MEQLGTEGTTGREELIEAAWRAKGVGVEGVWQAVVMGERRICTRGRAGKLTVGGLGDCISKGGCSGFGNSHTHSTCICCAA